MDTTFPEQRWVSLGELLKERRGRISPKYRIRRTFAEAVQVNEGMLRDIENHERETFTPATIATLEQAYQLAPGAIKRYLAGGTLDEMPPTSQQPGFVTSSIFPPLGVDTGPMPAHRESADAVRVPRWFAAVLERYGHHADQVVAVVSMLKSAAEEHDSTLGEILLEAGLVDAQDLRLRDMFEEEVQEILGDFPDLPNGVKREMAAKARELRKAMRPTQPE